jgi:transaldolase
MKLYADGADFDGIVKASKDPRITGFTTNPTLMAQAGVTDYKAFAHKTLEFLKANRPDTSISFEVFADDHNGMVRQAFEINSWGHQHGYDVYVKIPAYFTNGDDTLDVINELSYNEIKLNVTAVFTREQVNNIFNNLNKNVPSIISIFAGRIADTGVDPMTIFQDIKALKWLHTNAGIEDKIEYLWASPREIYNYVQAEQAGADIITMTPDLIKKLDNFGKDLNEFSLDTCKMFYNDATKSGFSI